MLLTVGAAALALSGCSAIGGLFPAEAERDESGQITAGNENTDIFSIRVGDCTNDVDTEEIASVPTVPCSEPHDNEAYFAYDIKAEKFPGNDAVLAEAGDRCVSEFDKFVGISYQESVLDVWPLIPTEVTWAEGDREVICFIYEPNADYTATVQATSSFAGTAR
ncbi:septum formation family protein [Diaminobutyricimonas sp. TR449]|uniref:septum formation family protein n=1 Tax=Diaminobutyricimonas sp. TR449 TaxID=2708076 RepID=UPI00141FAB58|nr:septum formation family protein [Diaminobutyricimonas sp. TR449]